MTAFCPECYRSTGHEAHCSASRDHELAPAPCSICHKPATPQRFHGGDSVGWRYDLLCPECRASVRENVPPAAEDDVEGVPI